MAPVAITGIGELKPKRVSYGETTLGLIARAATAAVADACLSKDDIDGLLVAQQVGETPQHVPATTAEYLGLRPSMAGIVDLGGASPVGMLWRAAAAIEQGMCSAVLCVAGVSRPGGYASARNRNPIREFDVPFGASGANVSYAMIAQAYLDSYSLDGADLAEIAVRERANAQLNPSAIFYGKPITVEDVLTSPMISSPIHQLEAVMESSGAAAFVVVDPQLMASSGREGVSFLGASEYVTHRALSAAPSLKSGPLHVAMQKALKRCSTKLPDIGLLQLYDCYTIVVALTVEDLGLCPRGAFGSWLHDHDLSHTGDFPLNTHGGQLGFSQPGPAGPMSHLIEAVRQLRGEAGGRQVQSPRRALVTGNGATMGEASACILEGSE